MDENIKLENIRCPICGAFFEDVGYEEFKGKWRFVRCGDCNYLYEVD